MRTGAGGETLRMAQTVVASTSPELSATLIE